MGGVINKRSNDLRELWRRTRHKREIRWAIGRYLNDASPHGAGIVSNIRNDGLDIGRRCFQPAKRRELPECRDQLPYLSEVDSSSKCNVIKQT